jgi:hypothetical protein
VVRKVGQPICGAALQPTPAGTIAILEKGAKAPAAVAAGEIVAITAVAGCPGED